MDLSQGTGVCWKHLESEDCMFKAGWEVSLSDIVPSFLIVFAMQQSRGCW